MLIRRAILARIVAGEIDLAFRRWRRPTVTAGGRLRTAMGELDILAVDAVPEATIDRAMARRAGYPDEAALLADLADRDGAVYRIALAYRGADPRASLRENTDLDATEIEDLAGRLDRMDARSRTGPWTRATLRAIEAFPGRPAAELARGLGAERDPFKRNVRKLKDLGLTESLDVGYRVSPRGRAFLAATAARDAAR